MHKRPGGRRAGGGLHKCYSRFSKVGKQHLGAFILHYVLGCIWEGGGGWADMMRLGSEVSICHSHLDTANVKFKLKAAGNTVITCLPRHFSNTSLMHTPWRSGCCRRDKPWRFDILPWSSLVWALLLLLQLTHKPDTWPWGLPQCRATVWRLKFLH